MILDATTSRGLIHSIKALTLMGDDRARQYLLRHPDFAKQFKRILHLYAQCRAEFGMPTDWEDHVKDIKYCILVDQLTTQRPQQTNHRW